MNESIIANKSYEFAKSVIYLYKKLTSEKKEFVLSKQVLRSGTSIGANVKEALRGQFKRDFLAKMYISMKEADETEYWIKLLMQCQELSKILNAIIKTTKNNLNLK